MAKHAAEDKRDGLPVFIHSELDDLGLTPFEFRAYAHLARRVNDKGGKYYESLEEGARICQMNVKTYRTALAGLVERGLVSREERPGQTSIYRLEPRSKWKTPTTSGRATESGRGTTSGRATPTTSGRTPLPNQVDKGTPPKVLPKKVLPSPPTPSQLTTKSESAKKQPVFLEEDPVTQPTHYQHRQATKPPDAYAPSRLVSFFPTAHTALVAFRRVHPKSVPDEQFAQWAKTVAAHIDAHGEAAVTAALEKTVANFPTLRTPWQFYETCLTPKPQPGSAAANRAAGEAAELMAHLKRRKAS